MTQDFNINIPETLRDIKLSQWQKYIEILDKNKDADLNGFVEKKLLGIFCGVELKDVDRIGLSLFDNTIQHLSNILNSKPELVKTFKMTGTDGVTVEFGLIPNFDKMSYGEFVDLERYLFVEKDLHRAMAVMYRPVKLKSKGSYLIHDYKGTEYLAEVMKSTPLDVALAARVFFYRLATKLSNFTMAYTLKELQQKQEGRKDKHSVKSGETIKQYLHSLKKMSEELEKLQNFQYTNV
jgi:hypothetical protein|tara:strand:- start:841 stop:1551 length:711 start_codon:yes stop_codon:yes gene_type:complete